MNVIRVCPFCKKREQRDLPIASSQLYDWMSGTLIQDAMPQLSQEEAEFVISGAHEECFDNAFAELDA